MKKLNFVLKNNNNEIINTVCEYYNGENSISFTYENMQVSLKKINEELIFLRDGESDSLEISKSNNEIRAYVKLKEYDIDFPIKVDLFNVGYEDNKVIIEYQIESDEGIKKTIILTLMK